MADIYVFPPEPLYMHKYVRHKFEVLLKALIISLFSFVVLELG